MQLLHEDAREQHQCVIVASHDLLVVELGQRVLRLQHGMFIGPMVRPATRRPPVRDTVGELLLCSERKQGLGTAVSARN